MVALVVQRITMACMYCPVGRFAMVPVAADDDPVVGDKGWLGV